MIIVNEMSERERQIPYDISYDSKTSHELIYETGTDLQT